MTLDRREFLEALAAAAAAGLPLGSRAAQSGAVNAFYDLPRYGNVSLLHITDTHAQLKPVYFREPSANIGPGPSSGTPPHLVGAAFLQFYGMKRRSRGAYAYTCLDFQDLAAQYGRMGGFAHLATLVKALKASRPGALLLDGGDSWQGSGVALWTQGQDMIDAQKLLGVDITTGHWEFTYGMQRVKQVVDGDFKGRIEFLAQNVATADFGDPVFKPYAIREIGGVPVAIIGQAFPYTPIANPRHFVSDWTFGIKEEELQKQVDDARAKGAKVVVLLSHNGMDVDLKLASRVRGLHAILGGHTHDAVPMPVYVRHAVGSTLVTNAGSNGKFVGVLDIDVRDGQVRGMRYHLLPVFSNLLRPDAAMQAHIEKSRAPYRAKLEEKLAVTEGLLYRRGNFNGTADQVILDALLTVKDAQIAFSPGFRWGTTLLPGEAITLESVMDWSAITYPYTTVTPMSGATIKTVLEDVCDNLFNPDPYYQQGGDMVRVGGMTYTCVPNATMGERIRDMRLDGAPIDAGKTYKVAGWAPVAEGAQGEPVWDVIAAYLRDRKSVPPPALSLPKLQGVANDPGLA
ncbi:MAG TPA: thiosulfohydrolase SoxB [Usitatibacter sp.]|nr:thiosulfohydrolase SoxB [Usitatibacter sp.]